MSVLGNFKNMGGHILGVLRRLTSNEDTEVVDDAESLNAALFSAVQDGIMSKAEALEAANVYVKSNKEAKKFSKMQVAGMKADSKGGFGKKKKKKSEDEDKEKNAKPSPEIEMDDREL